LLSRHPSTQLRVPFTINGAAVNNYSIAIIQQSRGGRGLVRVV
jgi:hypothetical protein